MAIGGNTIASKEMCDVLIEPPDLGRISGFEIGKAQELFNIGYEYTRKHFTRDRYNFIP